MKHSNSFWKRTIIGCSLLGMVIVTALPAQAAVQAATLNERTVSAVSTYTGTNAALATSKTAAINTATSTTNTTTNDATLTVSKTTAKKAALNKTSLKLKDVRVYGDLNMPVKRAAVCTGSGKSMISDALAAGADVYVTGDIDHHSGIDALQAGLAVIDAGHYGTEYIFMDAMKKRIQEVFDGLKVTCAKVQCPYTLMADL